MQGLQNTNVSKRFGFAPVTSGGSSLADSCLFVVDAGLCGILFVAPLVLGGRHLWGRFVFVLLSAIVAIAWFCRQALLKDSRWTKSWAVVIFLAALSMVALTLVPLNSEWLARLSPNMPALLPLWTSMSGEAPRLGHWQTLSVEPEATRIALAMLVTYGLLFLTVVQRLQSLEDIQRLLKGIALAAILMTSIGLAQYWTSNGLYFWFYDLPFSTTNGAFKGCFSNRNHFAQFLALGIGPLVAWIFLRQSTQANEPRWRGGLSPRRFSELPIGSVLLVLSLVIVVSTALLSLSRGGAMALVAATAAVLLIYRRRGLVPGHYLLGAAAMGLLVIGMLSAYGYEKVAHRMDDFASGSLDRLDFSEGRRKIWSANIAAFSQHWQTGTGAGSHRAIYPVHAGESFTVEYTHAENSYLQIATENGLPGVVLMTAGLLLIACWCFRSVRNASTKQETLCAGAISAGLAASAVHSLVDFVWFIPACLSIALLLAACALRLSQLVTEDAKQKNSCVPLGRWQWMGVATIVSLTAVWATSTLVGPALASVHWDRYLHCSINQERLNHKQLASMSPRAEEERQDELLNQTVIEHLQKVVHRRPDYARAHLRLAGNLLRQFDLQQQRSDNAMTSEQIRDAAMSSKFSSPQELGQWLNRAFGKNCQSLYRAYYHARQAAQLGPLQGEAYLYLARLCFLEGAGQDSIGAYVEQALKVRPNDGGVLFEAGRQSLLQGRHEVAVGYWKTAFKNSGVHQIHIIKSLGEYVTAESFLETFQPDQTTLWPLWKQYVQSGREEDLQRIASYADDLACRKSSDMRPTRASSLWLTVGAMHSELGDWDRAIISYQQAHERSPSGYHPRRLLGQALLESGRYAAAESHLRWCMSHRPQDQSLRRALLKATTGQLSQPSTLATRPAEKQPPQFSPRPFQK